MEREFVSQLYNVRYIYLKVESLVWSVIGSAIRDRFIWALKFIMYLCMRCLSEDERTNGGFKGRDMASNRMNVNSVVALEYDDIALLLLPISSSA